MTWHHRYLRCSFLGFQPANPQPQTIVSNIMHAYTHNIYIHISLSLCMNWVPLFQLAISLGASEDPDSILDHNDYHNLSIFISMKYKEYLLLHKYLWINLWTILYLGFRLCTTNTLKIKKKLQIQVSKTNPSPLFSWVHWGH